jgi:hypothetical protein
MDTGAHQAPAPKVPKKTRKLPIDGEKIFELILRKKKLLYLLQ